MFNLLNNATMTFAPSWQHLWPDVFHWKRTKEHQHIPPFSHSQQLWILFLSSTPAPDGRPTWFLKLLTFRGETQKTISCIHSIPEPWKWNMIPLDDRWFPASMFHQSECTYFIAISQSTDLTCSELPPREVQPSTNQFLHQNVCWEACQLWVAGSHCKPFRAE